MRNTVRCAIVSAAVVLLAAVSIPSSAEGVRSQSRSNVSGNRGGGGGGNRNAGANTNSNRNQNTNVNRNQNTNVNRNTNINSSTNVNVNVEGNGYGGCCYNDYHPVARAAAVTMTAMAVGSIVAAASMPQGCIDTVVNGMGYRQCGSTWYQPQISGSTTQYVVVNAPK